MIRLFSKIQGLYNSHYEYALSRFAITCDCILLTFSLIRRCCIRSTRMLENIIFIPCLREISTGRSIIYVPDGQHDIVTYAVYCLRDVLISPAIAIAFMQSSNLIDIYFCCLSELDHHSFKSFIALHRPPDLQERAHPQQVISSLSPLDQTTLGGLLHYESVIFSLSLSLQFFWCLREHSPDQWPCPPTGQSGSTEPPLKYKTQ